MDSQEKDDLYAVDPQGCRERRQRLVDQMQARDLELAILTRPESVQWLTGAYLGPLMAVAAAADADGRVTILLPQRKLSADCVADERVGYEAKWHSTMRSDMHRAAAGALLAALGDFPARVGVELSFAGALGLEAADDVEDLLVDLRRQKHADELRMMARANEANLAMFQTAREIIAPGLNELDLYNELHATAVRTLGEPLTYFGQDFRCAARGGAPRDRKIEAGEFYILDLGVGFRGYYSDNARTFAVGGGPSDLQQEAHAALAAVFPLIEERVRPGASCRALFEEVAAILEPAPGVFNHHLGHGVGLAPHEGPHLNPRWDDTFRVGDFFTVEPGLYSEELRAGLRLEQNYVVTEQGVELLTDWPLDM